MPTVTSQDGTTIAFDKVGSGPISANLSQEYLNKRKEERRRTL